MGFSPSSTKDRKSWLHQFSQSLRFFWETDQYITPPQDDGSCISSTIDSNPSVGFVFEYAIEAINKFAIKHMYRISASGTDIMWIHDIDGIKYFNFPNKLLLVPHNNRNLIVQNIDREDLECIINSLITHPIPHQHIESPIDNHDIRIGGGLINPFLYLFNLRYQLCPDLKMRDAEKDRLVDLFSSAVKNNKLISANSLMQIPSDY